MENFAQAKNLYVYASMQYFRELIKSEDQPVAGRPAPGYIHSAYCSKGIQILQIINGYPVNTQSSKQQKIITALKARV
jgi:hypothetical protein